MVENFVFVATIITAIIVLYGLVQLGRGLCYVICGFDPLEKLGEWLGV